MVSDGLIAFMFPLIYKEINEKINESEKYFVLDKNIGKDEDFSNNLLNNLLNNEKRDESTNNLEELSDSYVCSPLDQFDLIYLYSMDIPFLKNTFLLTNIGIYLTIASFIVFTFNILAVNYSRLFPNKWSLIKESLYATFHSIVINQINNLLGQLFLPFIYILFLFILINNLIGMIPYSFASTSHFILAFALSFTVVLGATLLGIFLHILIFFSLFVPKGSSLGILTLLSLIEFISYLARNISLGLRLAANLLSGHMLLSILTGFTYKIVNSWKNFLLGILPLAFITAFSALELGISFIQSQVFSVLACSYTKDTLMLH